MSLSLQSKRDLWLVCTRLTVFPTMVLFLVAAVACVNWWQDAVAATPGQLVDQAGAWIREYWLFACLTNVLAATSLVSYRQYSKCLRAIDANQR